MSPPGLTRLERLFSKRKNTSKSSSDFSEGSDSAEEALRADLGEATFPQPSFIRPKGSRMVARDETGATSQADHRASSVPEARVDRISMHIPKPSTASTGDIDGPPIRRVSSRRARKAERMHSSADMGAFRFPLPPRTSTERPPTSPATTPSTSPITPLPEALHANKRGLKHRHSTMMTPSRADTPPTSDHEEEPNPQRKGDAVKQHDLSTRATAAPPTPEASPEMKPVQELRTTKSMVRDSGLYLSKHSAVFSPAKRKEHKAELRRAQSQATMQSRSVWNSSKVLKGGDVKDFFNLSDDDIAEEELEMAEAPPALDIQAAQRPSVRSTRTTPTASPTANKMPTGLINPLADAAAHGAVQIARIAAKHKFDLVYIVNLWPDGPVVETPVPSSSHSSSPTSSLAGSTAVDGTVVETAAGMTGRLLAAYGLSKVASPFRISAAVHAKILRHKSWIEYRGTDAKKGEFSRGYGHAFHAGTSRRASAPGSSTKAPAAERPGAVDRGIVFAAYRQPGPDGTTNGCTPAELAALHSDVEYLVDMLIAIHRARRLRNPDAVTSLANEVGPMPSQPGIMCT